MRNLLAWRTRDDAMIGVGSFQPTEGLDWGDDLTSVAETAF